MWILHRAYEARILTEEALSDYSACGPRPTRAPAPTDTAGTARDTGTALAPAATVRPTWEPGSPGYTFTFGSTSIVILGGDRVPYDLERGIPSRDPAPDAVREDPMPAGDGRVFTHCRDLDDGSTTCWARAGWLVADPDTTDDAPWLGAPFAERKGSGWDHCRSVGGEDLACWHDGFLPPPAALPGRVTELSADLIPPGLTDPSAPGRALCRPAPGGARLCWLAYVVPDGGIWRPIVPVDAIHSSGLPDASVACVFGADGLGRDRAFCAPSVAEASLIAATPAQQPMYHRDDGSLCVTHARGEACWAPRPDITHHRPATWTLP